jgi:uncharacterized protein YbjT (DUF2867 family)
MNKTAIVFGASGLTGSHLLHELLESSDYEKIKVVTRHPVPLADPRLDQIVFADFDKLEEFAPSMKGDVVFICLGSTIRKAGSPDAFRKIDLTYPVTIAKIAEANQVPALVVMSSVGADQHSSVLYLRTKGEMEQQVRQHFTGALKILRPSMLLGSRKEIRITEEIGKVLTPFFGIFMLGRFRKYRGIHALSVAKAMVKLASDTSNQIIYESDEIARHAGPLQKISKHAVK